MKIGTSTVSSTTHRGRAPAPLPSARVGVVGSGQANHFSATRTSSSTRALHYSSVASIDSIRISDNRGRRNVRAQAIGAPGYYFRETAPWPTAENLPLTAHSLDSDPYVDLIVAGSGPAGVAAAERVAAAGFKVCVVDPEPLSHWPNNYGVWVDEFEAMGLRDCLEVIWPSAKVWLDSEGLGEKYLRRPYGRVDRPKLKRKLLEKCQVNGVTFLNAKVKGVSHGSGSSTVEMEDGRKLSSTLVLDCTGHSRKLVQYDKKFDPGFQGAYGIVAEVESHPFDTEQMLFMDWRDDHTMGMDKMRAENKALPTFLYAMPFSKTKIFLEETSLVARPAIGFNDLKERLDARLKWLGIKVTKIEEEEYCLIPMGGVLPKHPQRVLAVGGTAGMVHPSTGFMVSRALGAVPNVCDAIIEQLSIPTDKAIKTTTAPKRPTSEAETDKMAAAVWQAAWPIQRIRQRAFFTFGMDILLSLNLQQTRAFFNAFFSLSDFHWHGFLSARLTFFQLIGFGLSLFVQASSETRIYLLKLGLPGLIKMLLELVPTLGDYYGLESVEEKKKAADAMGAKALELEKVAREKVAV